MVRLADGEQYYPLPYSVAQLPHDVRQGLLPTAIMGTISATAAFAVISFITYRMVFWKKYYNLPVIYNQNTMLIYNLLWADFFQSVGFVVGFHWYNIDAMLAPTSLCSFQGAILNFGDLVSGVFVLFIAVHTMIAVLYGRLPSYPVFVAMVVGCWLFALLVTAIGPIMHPTTIFSSAGNWCWINPDYEPQRLYLHYIWIFVFEFGTLAIYAIVFFRLRKQLRSIVHTTDGHGISDSYDTGTASRDFPPRASKSGLITERSASSGFQTQSKVNRATYYMVLYPLTYCICTLPLAAGRMASMATGRPQKTEFYAAAGSLITSCGLVDALLYTLTRRVLASNNNRNYGGRMPPSGDHRRRITEMGDARAQAIARSTRHGVGGGLNGNPTYRTSGVPPSMRSDRIDIEAMWPLPNHLSPGGLLDSTTASNPMTRTVISGGHQNHKKSGSVSKTPRTPSTSAVAYASRHRPRGYSHGGHQRLGSSEGDDGLKADWQSATSSEKDLVDHCCDPAKSQEELMNGVVKAETKVEVTVEREGDVDLEKPARAWDRSPR